MPTCYVLLADGFEEIEALTPVDLLRRAGCHVVTIAVAQNPVMGAHGIAVTADRTADAVDLSAPFDLVLFPGGMPGATNLDENPFTDVILSAAAEHGAVVSAICAAPLVLGKRGLLCGKRATCYPGFESHLAGAIVEDVPVVTDGNIITGAAMGAAETFGLALVDALCGAKTADKVRASIHPRDNC